MPAPDDAWIDQQRRLLDAREAELQAEVRALDADEDTPSRQPRNQVQDAGELGEEDRREAIRHAERERDLDELREIEAARERMARGRYGECIDCGTEIPRPRLQVQPATARCAACQEKYERTHPGALRRTAVP